MIGVRNNCSETEWRQVADHRRALNSETIWANQYKIHWFWMIKSPKISGKRRAVPIPWWYTLYSRTIIWCWEGSSFTSVHFCDIYSYHLQLYNLNRAKTRGSVSIALLCCLGSVCESSVLPSGIHGRLQVPSVSDLLKFNLFNLPQYLEAINQDISRTPSNIAI